ncbi:enoyl-CoA hydratase/isomerase family protein [Parvularcula lutaonensis]|uniref:3-hydroxyisobutyryl-CoA hydrolase n=1 Tax=Parvularcula lutaonensis TaxID=491923 RepID=A0ABV7MC03_9PROT|nr:enoyl-CoA hydratase/isomerase family protein [Parvularcula lutaonensis]GGY49655.1 3-hydroxyisobutyryl-CoA hydrolase [Parvularcula lutaonensis]
MADKDILFARESDWGVITLNRPKALNALTSEMCVQMDAQLREWAEDDAVKAVLIEGAGEKAFCAGGDIRWLAETAREDPVEAATFFRKEYRLNNLIAHYGKPYIALIDGICMGGGVGVSCMADRRVMSSRTMWAMPECGIGLVPDVGASYALNQLKGGIGLYLALTGTRMMGPDCLSAEIATNLIADDQVDATREALLGADLSGDPLGAIDEALGAYNVSDPGDFVHSVRDIDHHFGKVESVAALKKDLAENGGSFGQGCLDRMASGSPTSQVLTLRLLNEAPDNFSDAIKREFNVTAHLLEGPDFLEGVRAQIIDKDRNPKWQPARVEDVDPARIDWYFTEPEGGPLEL